MKNVEKETQKLLKNTCVEFVPMDGRKGYGKVIKPSLPSRLIRFLKYGTM